MTTWMKAFAHQRRRATMAFFVVAELLIAGVSAVIAHLLSVPFLVCVTPVTVVLLLAYGWWGDILDDWSSWFIMTVCMLIAPLLFMAMFL